MALAMVSECFLTRKDGIKGPVVDGRPTSLPFNFIFNGCINFVGPVLFVGESGEEFIDLSDDQINEVMRFFGV